MLPFVEEPVQRRVVLSGHHLRGLNQAKKQRYDLESFSGGFFSSHTYHRRCLSSRRHVCLFFSFFFFLHFKGPKIETTLTSTYFERAQDKMRHLCIV